MLRKVLLEQQADQIELLLQEHKVEARVTGGSVLPQVIIHRMVLAAGQRLKALESLHREIALALGVPGVLIGTGADGISIEVPRIKPATVTLRNVLKRIGKAPPPHTALLGLGNDSRPLMLFMPSPNIAHVLIAGTTGSGKTELLRTMVTTLTLWGKRQEMAFFLVDPKQRKLAALAGLPTVLECCGAPGAVGLLERLVKEMERRDTEDYHSPWIYLVIDEIADLILVGGRPIEAALIRLLQRGREAGISVVAATQRPSSEICRGLMKANFPVRISGAVVSATDANVALGIPRSGAQRLLGKGDMVLAEHGRLLRFQACLSRAEIGDLLTDSRPKRPKVAVDLDHAVAQLQHALGLRGPGRPQEPLDREMISWIEDMIRQFGGVSQRAVRDWHQEHRGTDCNPDRVVRHIETARARLFDGTCLS